MYAPIHASIYAFIHTPMYESFRNNLDRRRDDPTGAAPSSRNLTPPLASILTVTLALARIPSISSRT